MKYVSLALAVLTMLLMVSVPALASEQIVLDPLAEDIPDWALVPAEDPDDTADDTVTSVTPTEPVTVTDENGNVIYQDDGTASEDPTVALTEDTPDDTGRFLTKSFEDYTVTEGFLLLFLILGFCLLIWKIVKGVL